MIGSRLTRSPRQQATLDFCVLSGLVAVANAVFTPSDPGWVRSNPSPWLLIPILLGCRYGFTAGIVAGCAIGAGIVTLAARNMPVATFFAEHGYLIGALVLTGGLCGEIHSVFHRREVQLEAEKEKALSRLRQLDGDFQVIREGKAELERLLATRDAELATLDSDLRRLYDAEGEELFTAVLLLLNRHVRVSEAAIYWHDGEDRLQRKAALGQSKLLPAQISRDQIQMIALAMRDNACVTIPEFWRNATPEQAEYLLAAPFVGPDGKSVGALIVTSMPFIALNSKTVQLINLICRWSGRVLEARNAGPGSFRPVEGMPGAKVHSLEFFRKNLELAHDSFERHSLPGGVVVLSLPSALASLQPALERKLVPFFRAGDYNTTIGWKTPHLAVLLPLTGERGAMMFVNRVALGYSKSPVEGHALTTQIFTFKPGQSLEQFWRELEHADEKSAVAA